MDNRQLTLIIAREAKQGRCKIQSRIIDSLRIEFLGLPRSKSHLLECVFLASAGLDVLEAYFEIVVALDPA